MSAESDAVAVARRIKEILINRKFAAVYALAKQAAQEAENDFRDRQNSGTASNGILPWQNRTGQAMARVRFRAYIKSNAIGFRGWHGVPYGIYLERANDRKYEAIRPIVFRFGAQFIKDAREILK